MNHIEDDLKAALRRKPAPPGFAAKVFERIEREASNKKTLWSFLRSWARGAFRKEILAFASAVMLILGGVMHLSGKQSVLANSISQLKVIMDVSAILKGTTSMDCSVLKSGAGGENSYYRVRWDASGITRVDRKSTDGVQQTLWISNTTVPPDPVWQPAMEFLTPSILAAHIEGPYGLMRAGQRDAARPDELLLVGKENQHAVEIVVDERTYLPKSLKKYLPDSGRTDAERDCLMEVRFQWNQPISRKLLVPDSQAANRQLIHLIQFCSERRTPCRPRIPERVFCWSWEGS
jgi:hypothetical protein